MISVIIPVFNVEDKLYICLNSVLKQNYQDFEIICIEDASTDFSLEVLKYFSQKDSRINIYENESKKGFEYCKNKGLEIAKGDKILFLNANEWLGFNFLETFSHKSDYIVETNLTNKISDFGKVSSKITQDNFKEKILKDNNDKYDNNGTLINLKKYSECNFNNNSQKIGLFVKGTPENYPATAHIRLLQIFDSISKDDLFCPCIIDNNEIKFVKEDIENRDFLVDAIIIQRDVLDSNFSKQLIKYCNQFDIKIIYEIDDDLLNIDKTHPEYEYYSKSAKIIKFILKNSNQVIVSTKKLKDKLLSYTNNIEVIGNTLVSPWRDKYIFLNKKAQNIIKIGYMGTITHENDIKIIEKSIIDVKKYFHEKNINVEFEFIGGTKKELKHCTQIEIPKNRSNYPKFVKWLKETVDWNIAIAPLENNNINSSKSEIKYLEYVALGLPGIYSAVGAYEKVIENGKNGILVYDNISECWTKNIIKLIENENLQNEILRNSKIDVQQNYFMNIAVKKWKNILINCRRNTNSLISDS